MSHKNLLIAQSGGPSPVINSSLRGIVETARQFPDRIGTVYAGWHGIEGVLGEQLLDLSVQDRQEIALLRTTPAAGAIGTCRYKVRSAFAEDFERILAVFKAHNIGYFLYNGGNDSMDTANKIARLATERGLSLTAVGVPKTIDNDVGDSAFKLIDHTPGYGSVARYWALMVQNAEEENRGAHTSDPVLVLQAMGREIGFIPAAARLADPGRRMPLLIFLAESKLSLAAMAELVNATVMQRGRALVVVSEGCEVGGSGVHKDAFGHVEYDASETSVQQTLVNYLNQHKLPARGAARGQNYGTDQRSSAIYASTVDLDEAFNVGRKAVLLALAGETGCMATILRDEGPIYSVRYDSVPLADVANSERCFPAAWIGADKIDVTDRFVDYARPLIGEDWPGVPMVDGRQRFACLSPSFAAMKLPAYVPQGYRQ